MAQQFGETIFDRAERDPLTGRIGLPVNVHSDPNVADPVKLAAIKDALVWWRRAPAPPRQQPVSLTVGDRTASARITERTPWGSYSVAGVGAPPFTVEPIELMTLS